MNQMSTALQIENLNNKVIYLFLMNMVTNHTEESY